MSEILTPRAVRVRTSEGWQDVALRGPPGPPGPPGREAPLVTDLPANPADGDEVYFRTPGEGSTHVVWHLRYNAALGSSWPWEFIGGAPISVGDGGAVGTPPYWIGFAGIPPIPRSGLYSVGWSDTIGITYGMAAPLNVIWDGTLGNGSWAFSGGDYGAKFISYTRFSAVYAYSHHYMFTRARTPAPIWLAPGTVLQVRYDVSAWDVVSYSRSVEITPIRLA